MKAGSFCRKILQAFSSGLKPAETLGFKRPGVSAPSQAVGVREGSSQYVVLLESRPRDNEVTLHCPRPLLKGSRSFFSARPRHSSLCSFTQARQCPLTRR